MPASSSAVLSRGCCGGWFDATLSSDGVACVQPRQSNVKHTIVRLTLLGTIALGACSVERDPLLSRRCDTDSDCPVGARCLQDFCSVPNRDTDDVDVDSQDATEDPSHAPDTMIPDDDADSGNCADRLEICDGLDNDCDGEEDEGVGMAPCPVQEGVCAGAMGACVGGQRQCGDDNYLAAAVTNGSTFDGVGAPEFSCDGADNNCDGQVDERCCSRVNDAWQRVDLGVAAAARQLRPSLLRVPGGLLVAWQDTDAPSREALDDGSIRLVSVPDDSEPVLVRESEAMVEAQVLPVLVGTAGGPQIVFGAVGDTVSWIHRVDAAADAAEERIHTLPQGSHVSGIDATPSATQILTVWDEVSVDGRHAIRAMLVPDEGGAKAVRVADNELRRPAVAVLDDTALIAYWDSSRGLRFRAFDASTLESVGGNNVHQLDGIPAQRPDVFTTDTEFRILYTPASQTELLLMTVDRQGASVGIPPRIRTGASDAIRSPRGVSLGAGVGVTWLEGGTLYYRLVPENAETGDTVVLRTASSPADAGIAIARVSSQEFAVATVDSDTGAVHVGRFNALGLPLCRAQ